MFCYFSIDLLAQKLLGIPSACKEYLSIRREKDDIDEWRKTCEAWWTRLKKESSYGLRQMVGFLKRQTEVSFPDDFSAEFA